MAVIQKTLFAKNLDKYAVLVNDTEPNSRYFKITELPDTFTGGKNAFLVAGSKELVPDTKIQIELRDSAGNIIYHEPGEGYISSSLNGTPFVTEYYEGVSKVVSVYVYPDTAYGPCTLTILGELSEYTDANGIVVPVGLDWENKYNVKWTKTINVNPALANTTKIRFYQRPTATITEILSPIYSIVGDNKVASAVTQSFANIKLSKLETFAGDVKRVKVFRTSQGDISDYDLIQDILIESKELLTSYGLSGSVIGETGILTSETLKNYWNTGSLNTFLTSSRVESGVRLTGSGYFRYTSSLDIKSANTYELNLDAFYSSSTSSNLGVYLSWVSQSTTFSSSIATLVGTTPTKNLLDTVVPFKIDTDYPTASLYFSQSQGEWHLGNISLKLSQDTAFSPDEVSFVTTMPTVLGNETFNFKFEFYDVNNNYVPVAVTQSATFNGGNTNIGGTILLISSSASSSLADLNRVSSSISGTMTVYSSSASGSIGIVSGSVNILSGSVSSSISSLSSSVSQSSAIILSSSFAQVKNLANGQYSGSFIGDKVIYSPVIGGQIGYIKELFTVGDTTSATINLDARTTTRKIWIGTGANGTYNSTNTSVYLDSGGQFSLKDKLSWDGNSLSIQGTLKIADGTGVASSSDLSNGLSGKISTGAAASDVNNNVTTISGGKIRTGLIQSNNFSGTGDGSGFTTAGMSIDLTGGGISAKNFRITAGGDAFFNGAVTATSLTLSAGVKVPNESVDGLGSLALKSSVSATTDVTGLGALATRSTVNATYIDANSITTGLIAANTIVAGNIASNTITADQISGLNFTGKTATFNKGTVGGWNLADNLIYNTNVDIDNSNSRIDFKSAGVVKTRLTAAAANIGATAVSAINIPAQASDNDFYQGDGSTFGAQDRTFTLSQSITETSITTPANTTGNKLSLKIPTYTIGTLGTVNFGGFGSYANSFNYGYRAYVTYKVSSTPGASGDIASGTYYFYNGYYNDFTGIPQYSSFTLPGVNGGSIPVYSGTATAGQVFYISATYYIEILTRANMASGSPPDPVDSTTTWNVSSPGWPSVSSNAIIVAVANRAEYGSNGVQIGTGDGNYAAMGDAAGSGLSGLFNGSVQIYGTLTAALASSSDRRAKTNIKPLQNATDTLKKLNPVSFDWLQHQINTTDFKHSYGFIADEVQTILPNLVLEKKGLEYDDFKYLDYNSFHALAIKAILELTEKVEKLEAKISGSI